MLLINHSGYIGGADKNQKIDVNNDDEGLYPAGIQIRDESIKDTDYFDPQNRTYAPEKNQSEDGLYPADVK